MSPVSVGEAKDFGIGGWLIGDTEVSGSVEISEDTFDGGDMSLREFGSELGKFLDSV